MKKKTKVIHIGNILNNGYLNCKFLRRNGVNADLMNVDYRHVQGQPEWEEVSVRGGGLDHFQPDWSKVELNGFERPSWYYETEIRKIATLAESIQKRGLSKWRMVPVISDAAAKIATNLGLAPMLQPFKRRIQVQKLSGKSYFDGLLEKFASFYPDSKQLAVEDIAEWKDRADEYAHMLSLYQLVQAYGLDPIYPLLGCPGLPYICFEHGTLRDFPYEDSSRGRLYALSLQLAEHVIITNADVVTSAQRLGLQRYSFIPHPVDEQLYQPRKSPLADVLRKEHDADLVFLAPARHHWKRCPPGMETSWFKRNDILIRGLAELRRRKPDLRFVTVFFEWGQEVEESKKLIGELGLDKLVRWEPICSKQVMADFYNAADVVLDQFNAGIGTFGTVVPESLACGKPVILNYKEELHRWCYPELPPVSTAADPEGVADVLGLLTDDASLRRDMGEQGRKWFLTHHCSSVVVERHLAIYRSIADRSGWNPDAFTSN
jgi:glycosyltransferase involved in cell wall biosynthesis